MSKMSKIGLFVQQLGLKGHPKLRGSLKILLAIALLGATVRMLPYLAPIRAEDIAQNEQAVTFSDRNGLPLGTLLTRDQDHTAVVAIEQVSEPFLQAIIAAEDKRYYQHGAVDLQAVARAVLEAVQARSLVSGASTITMQLARMLEPAPRTLPNKLGEVWLSWRLFAGMNRDEILQAYINRLPMGGNIYGVEAAARTYFGLPA
ncbi:MAG: transglycosylase domain-containing protein, partial [Chroococcales cyanobacterium]